MKKLINNILGYFSLELKRKSKLVRILEEKLTDSKYDDFNWNTYTNKHYADQLREIENIHTLKLKEGDYDFADGSLIKRSDVLPLHPNHRLLYETIGLLKPIGVLEVGSGGGDHLFNLKLLLPKLDVFGLDRSEGQIAFAEKRSPNLVGATRKFDATLPLPYNHPMVDLAFTQTVIMHIKTGNGHLVALANLFKVAIKQVVLMENWSQHPFYDDIQHLFDQGIIPWKEIYYYIRRAPELQDIPHLMIVSSEELPLEKLENYEQLSRTAEHYAVS